MSERKQEMPFTLVVRQGGTRYGIDAACVLEAMQVPPHTAMPQQREMVRGIFIYKGEIGVLISLSALSGTGGEEPVCVVCRTEGQVVAFSVEQVEDVLADPPEQRGQVCDNADGYLAIHHVIPGEEPVFVLDLPRMNHNAPLS